MRLVVVLEPWPVINYFKQMNRLARQHQLHRHHRYDKARETANRLAQLLRLRYQAKQVVLVGSCTRESAFGEHSDIDLCVSGIDPARYYAAVGELLIEAGEFDIDLVPIEDATPEMAAQLAKGEVLYDDHT